MRRSTCGAFEKIGIALGIVLVKIHEVVNSVQWNGAAGRLRQNWHL
jgi:hypothetical protein